MRNVKQDRKELQRLVESYGKEDVTEFINHINEEEEVDPKKAAAIKEAITRIQPLKLNPEQFAKIKMMFEILYDYGYSDGFDDGVDDGEESASEEVEKLKKQVSDAGWQYEYDHRDDWRTPREMGQW